MLDDLISRRRVFWAMFNQQLIIVPKAAIGSNVEITGALTPPKYTDSDLFKDMVRVPTATTEVQGLSDTQLKLVRYRVIARLYEDKADPNLLQKASYFDNKARQLEHMMKATHEDGAYTDSNSLMRGHPTDA
jgi:hypothetical protein